VSTEVGEQGHSVRDILTSHWVCEMLTTHSICTMFVALSS